MCWIRTREHVEYKQYMREMLEVSAEVSEEAKSLDANMVMVSGGAKN